VLNARRMGQLVARAVLEVTESLRLLPTGPLFRPLLRAVWGPWPWLALLFAVLAAVVGWEGARAAVVVVLRSGTGEPGARFLRALSGVPFRGLFFGPLVAPVLLFSAIAAWRLRGLRRTKPELLAASDPKAAFTALALPFLPATVLLCAAVELRDWMLAPVGSMSEWADVQSLAGLLETVVGLLLTGIGVTTSICVCVATFAFRRNWFRALFELMGRFMALRIMIWAAGFAIGIMGKVIIAMLTRVLASVLMVRIPPDLAAVFSTLSEHAIEILAYLAVIAGTWIVAQRCLGRWLRTGDVDFLHRLSSLFGDDDEDKKAPKERADAPAETPPTARGGPPSMPPPLPPSTDETGG
jgi:hypothetical protein